MEDLFQFWQEFRQQVRVADLCDVAIVAAFVYVMLRWVRHRASRAVVSGLSILALIYVLALWMQMHLTLALFRTGIVVLLIALVVIFQQDIRRALEQLSALPGLLSRSQPPVSTPTVEVLCEAVGKLAHGKIGALIIIPGNQPVEGHLRGGVNVRGKLSIPLLLSIFNPSSPGHDGGVVIEGETIEKLGVHLPLSRNLARVGRNGTRHTAALGLSECCDALIIVVSEELGTISVAERGEISVLRSVGELKIRLEIFRSLRGNRGDSSTPTIRVWLNSTALKLLSVGIAAILWYSFAFQIENVQRQVADVPIEFRNLPESWVIRDIEPAAVGITVQGSERSFASLDRAALVASVDLNDLPAGTHRLPLDSAQLNLPFGLAVERFEPEDVFFRLARLVVMELPIAVAGPRIIPDRLEIRPARVRVLLPADRLAEIKSIPTESLDNERLKSGKPQQVRLKLPRDVQVQPGAPNQVTVSLKVESSPTNSNQQDNKSVGK